MTGPAAMAAARRQAVVSPLVAATPNARYVEFFWDDQVLNFRRLIDRQLEQENGYIKLHQTPGLGFDFDEQAVARYSIAAGGQPWMTLENNR